MLQTVLVVLLILALVGAVPAWPYSANWGYYPSGGLGLVLLIVVILLSQTPQLAQAIGMLGSVAEPLPLGPATGVQFANQFMGLVDRHLRILIAVQQQERRIETVDVKHGTRQLRELFGVLGLRTQEEVERRSPDA